MPYSKRLQYFFTANKIDNTDQTKVLLLTVVGRMAFKLLRSLVAPEKLNDESYSDLVEAMMKHHNPKPSEIVHRYKFNSQSKQ